MTALTRPFPGLRPAAGLAEAVAAPPYDVVSLEEARAMVAGRPWSFLHVSRPEIDLPDGTDPYDAAVYEGGAATFRRMRQEGVLQADPGPRYYVYRLVQGGHQQTGVVIAASVVAYESGRIRRHELTRPQKEDDRVRHMVALGAQTGPAFLTYRWNPVLDRLVAEVTAGSPEVDFTAPDGVAHTLWVVAEPQRVEAFSAAFEAVERLYIADGHHRSAAAARLAQVHREAGGAPDAPSRYFLAVAFPDAQMRILAYHRVVRDLGQQTPTSFVERLGEWFEVTPSGSPVAPAAAGEIGLFLESRWLHLRARPGAVPPEDPVARLDVSLLSERVLGPLLGIEDLRRDPRIDFVGGIRGLEELERRVRSGEMAAAFALGPTRLSDLMAVADAGLMMPPKSTWFEPKLADGLVSHLL
jgi:uncharacterized protein (DUF1015 family)